MCGRSAGPDCRAGRLYRTGSGRGGRGGRGVGARDGGRWGSGRGDRRATEWWMEGGSPLRPRGATAGLLRADWPLPRYRSPHARSPTARLTEGPPHTGGGLGETTRRALAASGRRDSPPPGRTTGGRARRRTGGRRRWPLGTDHPALPPPIALRRPRSGRLEGRGPQHHFRSGVDPDCSQTARWQGVGWRRGRGADVRARAVRSQRGGCGRAGRGRGGRGGHAGPKLQRPTPGAQRTGAPRERPFPGAAPRPPTQPGHPAPTAPRVGLTLPPTIPPATYSPRTAHPIRHRSSLRSR